MPVITKCKGNECPHRDNCYRYTVKTVREEDREDFQYNHQKHHCDEFIPNTSRLIDGL